MTQIQSKKIDLFKINLESFKKYVCLDLEELGAFFY
jgi:hypothetical protein